MPQNHWIKYSTLVNGVILFFKGACWGWTSLCSKAGYDMESHCHWGQRCIYPSNSTGQVIFEHRLSYVIPYMINNPLPKCTPNLSDCNDMEQCHQVGWTFRD